MNKRIAPLFLCFVMVFAMLATAAPAFAEENTNKGVFTVKVDKTTANPGDVINVTLILTPPSGKLTAFQGFFQVDTGLTYVANSGKIPDGLKASLGFDSVDWTESSKMVNGFGSTVYEGTADIVLAELQYKVDDNAAVGSVLKISLDEIEVCDATTDLVESAVIPATITVAAAPKPATGITLNKSELPLTAGESDTSLTATVTPEGSTDTVVWSSSNTDVATVDSATGKVTAVAPGEATITATAGTKTATCTVKVQAAPCTHESVTPVPAKDPTCTADGNKEYYRCTCGKLFEDAAAATEITDHSSVVLPKTGHSYTVQNSDEAHKRSTAADCREFDTYWYTCANDAAHSAKDDAAAADKFYNGEQGAHVYGNEWVDRGEAGHAHKCQYHDAYDAVQPHTPDHEGGATYDYAVKCTECGRVLEPQREQGTIRIEVPFKLTVKKTGEMTPGQETFKFAIEKFGATTTYTVVQDTVETNGEKTYEGKFIFTISEDQAGNLSEGFVIRQVKGSAEGWTYDETKFYAIPMFVDSYTSVAGWTFCKYDENGELDYNNPIEEIGFTNSYSAKKPVTPPAPQNPESPKTGDSSMMGLWVALLLVSGAAMTGTVLYSRKKRVNNR